MIDERNWPTVLTALLEGADLSVSQAEWAMARFMTGEASGAQVGAFLVALRSKGVTVEEVIGFRDAILAEALPIALPPMSLDIVGTGGDRFGTVNVSTMASITAAAAGVPVVKHGNRAASSQSGSSDVLSALGIDLGLDAAELARAFEDVGIAFVHAARFLPGFRHVAPARAELGIPTVFNFLGPLCNPVRPEASAVGVADIDRVPIFVGVFRLRGASALVFRGDDGLDELTTTGHSRLWEVSRGGLTEHDIDPRDLGIPRAEISDLVGGTPDENAAVVRRVFDGERGPVRDIVLLNAAAGMVAYDLAQRPESVERALLERLHEKLRLAEETIDSGRAAAKLADWAAATAAARGAQPAGA
ncbi:anthranilate phosphoribosyltransferase [Leucobacter luti]|uniref:Anthranilate phosphoribosyltransferase n=1 Tax=Leucobacter luti TaxID=340320 RepID=A0A4Q7TK67_9MICO|nr:anthranilate phosphoribosyltransferase [Leucobacter luti]MBL3700262.1 anthranilate phosphoribosyltransferase [Leucobacter luti]RZT61014.1 anthranilate phosphoribosyltransferase [Leucobacter luti]